MLSIHPTSYTAVPKTTQACFCRLPPCCLAPAPHQNLKAISQNRCSVLPRPTRTHQTCARHEITPKPIKVTEKDAAQKGYPHSYIEKLWDDMYLEGRWALPINSNPYLALKPAPKDTVAPAASDPQIMGATRRVCRASGGKGEGFFLMRRRVGLG